MALILVVEDRPVDRKLLTVILRSGGHEVIEAGDGAEALSILDHQRPDLIISDILMPTLDGYELVRRIRERPALAAIPVVFQTAAYHAREAHELARRCGVAAIMTKPSAADVVLPTVDRMLAASTRARPPDRDREGFDHEHLKVVTSALTVKVTDLEVAEQRMTAIVNVAHEIAAECDVRRLLQKVCSAAREVTFAQTCSICMLNDGAPGARRFATSGIDETLAHTYDVAALDGPLLTPVLVDRQPVRVTNPGGKPDAIGLPVNQPPIHSCLVLPLASRTRTYGWLALANKLGSNAFTDRDEDVALALATHAGIAYENALLLDGLRDTNERTEFALLSVRMGIWEVEIPSRRVSWSHSLAPLFGLTPDRVPTDLDQFIALVHARDQQAVSDAMGRAMTEAGEFNMEFRSTWPDGSVHWMAARARVVRADGRAARLLGVGIDISDQKQLQDQFRQAQKMEAVGQLAGGVAHDFNNLLTAVLGNANLLLEEEGVTPAIREEAEEIIKAGERAAALTRQLLTFGRKQVMQPTNVDLNALASDMSQMLRRVIGEHIELATEFERDLPSVRADQTQLEQVLMNLAVNARDAMPDGGRLLITTSTAGPDAPFVMLAITDNGTGMDEPTRQRLFEPFFTTKARGKGTGLGLATVYGIVTQSGGHVGVETDLGRGTTFTVYLPVAAQLDPAPDVPAAAARPSRGSEMLLVVEDEMAVRNLTRVLLEKSGYRVLVAANAQEAADLFARYGDHIDLLITDILMPGVSGPALMALLTERYPGLKVLYMSGYADDAVPANERLHPDAVFLQKPFTSDRLIHKVREALAR